jgi:pimeloyl-ACP methyl ester carboxylesterase
MLSGFSPGANSRRRGRASGRAVLYDRCPHPVKETRRLPFGDRAYPPGIGYGTCPGGRLVAGEGKSRGRARRPDPLLDPRLLGAGPRRSSRLVGCRAAPAAGPRASHHLLRPPQPRPLLVGRGQVEAGHLLRRGRPRDAASSPRTRAPGGDRPLVRLGHRATARSRPPGGGGRVGAGGAVRPPAPPLARDRDAQPGRDDPAAGIDTPGSVAGRQGPPHRPTCLRPGVDAPLPPPAAGGPQGEHRPHPARRLRPADWLERVYPSLGDWDWRPRLPSLRVPVLLVWGESERGPPEVEREWLSGLPDGRMVAVPGAGHWPFCENPEVFFPAVERFLDG